MLQTENAKIRRLNVTQLFLNSTPVNPDDNINSESVRNNSQSHQNNIMAELMKHLETLLRR